MFDKSYDVFIAYHGSYDDNGTQGVACSLYEFLKENGISAYFFPMDASDSYKTTILEVMKAKTFILVCNQTLTLTDNMRIDQARHYQLLAEIDTFYALTQTGEDVSTLDAKILACVTEKGKIKKGDLQEYHQLFSSRTHEYCVDTDKDRSFVTMLEWVKARKVAWTQRTDSWREKQVSTEVKHTLATRSAMNQFCNLSSKVAVAKSIKIIGITNLEVVSKVDDKILQDVVKRGGKIEIIFLDPEGTQMQLRMEEESDARKKLKRKTKDNIEDMLDIQYEMDEEKRANFKLFKTDVVPRMNMIFVDDFLVLQYYANFTSGKDNPCFLIEKQEVSPLYDFCMLNYNKIKEFSTEILLED